MAEENLEFVLSKMEIYSNKTLQEFILSLENKYKIEIAGRKKYNKLVNFSANIHVPYHQWFLYREGFAAELIEELIQMSNCSSGEYIIDPFCGSGTTNVVAALNGYKTLGLDVNPMSAFITNAKVDSYTDAELNEVLRVLPEVKNAEPCPKTKYESIERYFSPTNFNELLRLKCFVDKQKNEKTHDLLMVAFLSIILDCSDRKRDGNGLKCRLSKIDDVEEYYINKVKLIVNDIKSVDSSNKVKGDGLFGSATRLSELFSTVSEEKAGAVIFSPPYANSFDYFESYKLELVFGDYSDGISGLKDLRKLAVRNYIGGSLQDSCDKFVDMIAQEIEKSIPKKEMKTGKKDVRTRKVPNMIKGYFDDMNNVIKECYSVLRKGGKTYIVVDQSAYLGVIVPTDLLFAYFAENCGFRVEQIIECRKARTSTQQLNEYPFLKTALRESIVVLVKD